MKRIIAICIVGMFALSGCATQTSKQTTELITTVETQDEPRQTKKTDEKFTINGNTINAVTGAKIDFLPILRAKYGYNIQTANVSVLSTNKIDDVTSKSEKGDSIFILRKGGRITSFTTYGTVLGIIHSGQDDEAEIEVKYESDGQKFTDKFVVKYSCNCN